MKSYRHDDSIDSGGSVGSYSSPPTTYNEDISNFDQAMAGGNSTSSFDASWDGRQTSNRLMNQEGVFQLTKDLRKFSEALTALKTVFMDVQGTGNQGLRVLAHERLSDLLQVLRSVVDKYSELNSNEILAVAAQLIKHVKEFNYDDLEGAMLPEIFRALNNLAMVFSNSVSECLMGDANINPHLATSQSFDSLDTSKSTTIPEELETTNLSEPMSSETFQENIEDVLYNMDNGLEMAFERAKILSKYLGDLINYVKKKAHLEIEHAKGLLKLSQATKPVLSEQSFLPFQSLYCTGLDHEREYASNCQSMYQSYLLQQKFVEPLQAKKNEHDKRRKSIRDLWARDKKRTEDVIANMKKSKQSYIARTQECQKAKEAAMRAEIDQNQTSGPGQRYPNSSLSVGSVLISTTSGKVEKKKKQEEESIMKATAAENTYKASVKDANAYIRDLDKNKASYLQQLRDSILQCDQTAKTVTTAYFQHHHKLFAPLPIQYQAMAEDAKRYEPGSQYSDYIRNLPPQPYHAKQDFEFEPYNINGNPYLISPGSKPGDSDEAAKRRNRFAGKGNSDTESSSSRSLDDLSPSASPGDLMRPRDPQGRRRSTEGSLSSEELLDENFKDAKTTPGLSLPSMSNTEVAADTSPLPTRSKTNRATNKASRMAANVRDAFKSKKSTKSSLFGVDFAVAAQTSLDGIPYLVKQCIAEIDNRALLTKGIYRVNGVKNRVEKLCSLFDSSPDRVDLSEQSPHDVSGVLKYFLRQLPEPLLQFNLYNVFLDIAKDYQQLITSTNEAVNKAKEEGLPEPSPPDSELNSFVARIRDSINTLPTPNRNTLQYIVSHLTRVSYHSRDNKMTASNIAIVFGPTLLRPLSSSDVNESLKTLIDMPYQSRIVEMLIIHKDFIFGTHSHQAGNIFPFSGFQHSQPGFPPEEKTIVTQINPIATDNTTTTSNVGKMSLDNDQSQPISKDTSNDGIVLLNFDDDTVTSTTDSPPSDSQTSSIDFLQTLAYDSREIVPNSPGLIDDVICSSSTSVDSLLDIQLNNSISPLSSSDDLSQKGGYKFEPSSTRVSSSSDTTFTVPNEGLPPVPVRSKRKVRRNEENENMQQLNVEVNSSVPVKGNAISNLKQGGNKKNRRISLTSTFTQSGIGSKLQKSGHDVFRHLSRESKTKSQPPSTITEEHAKDFERSPSGRIELMAGRTPPHQNMGLTLKPDPSPIATTSHIHLLDSDSEESFNSKEASFC